MDQTEYIYSKLNDVVFYRKQIDPFIAADNHFELTLFIQVSILTNNLYNPHIYTYIYPSIYIYIYLSIYI